MGLIVPKKIDKDTYINAAKTIQRAWRRYAARKKLKNRNPRVGNEISKIEIERKSIEIKFRGEFIFFFIFSVER